MRNKKKISWIIDYKLNDPRLYNILISIFDVCISKDYSHAKIYVSFLNNKKKLCYKTLLHVLQSSSKYIRYLLARQLRLRIIPKLHFFHDNSYNNGVEITLLINDILNKCNNK
ncbi:MAG: 30S ribosome-binding factor RbfA [Buchnera aphidicola (Chaetogeoica yunlongensis)]